MQTAQPNLFTRDDTLLGVCEALGEDFGFNPLWLRLTLPLLLFFNPVATIAGYLALGAVVLLSRLLFPKPRLAGDVASHAASEPVEPEQDWVRLAA